MTEVDLLQQSLDEMDRTHPGWDHEALAAACRAALEDGVDEEALEQTYGQAMLRDAKLAAKSNVIDDMVFVEPVGSEPARYLADSVPGRVVGYGHISDENQGLLKLMHVGDQVEVVRTAGAVGRVVMNGKKLLAVGITAIASSLNANAKGR
ncbi:hypothetical protein AS156_29230 [Bradyrhizobium macuxiense]|uniref:Uncharacterized protein n=1 Tax=Bradyrhizobium macuxiense TaxID=1755647 RepID=A0A109K4V5_9BRAD|nr:hypothetical protein [Bradyrhizobium macuxiense]KWV60464.1 hypothetical protein AS156_29230 [Bradyrhizobium macuxiense]